MGVDGWMGGWVGQKMVSRYMLYFGSVVSTRGSENQANHLVCPNPLTLQNFLGLDPLLERLPKENDPSVVECLSVVSDSLALAVGFGSGCCWLCLGSQGEVDPSQSCPGGPIMIAYAKTQS